MPVQSPGRSGLANEMKASVVGGRLWIIGGLLRFGKPSPHVRNWNSDSGTGGRCRMRVSPKVDEDWSNGRGRLEFDANVVRWEYTDIWMYMQKSLVRREKIFCIGEKQYMTHARRRIAHTNKSRARSDELAYAPISTCHASCYCIINALGRIIGSQHMGLRAIHQER